MLAIWFNLNMTRKRKKRKGDLVVFEKLKRATKKYLVTYVVYSFSLLSFLTQVLS